MYEYSELVLFLDSEPDCRQSPSSQMLVFQHTQNELSSAGTRLQLHQQLPRLQVL